MFNQFTTKDKRSNLEREIDKLILHMSTYERSTEEYADMADTLETLYKAKANERQRYISPDTLVVVAGNLAGIVLILSYEKLNVVTSKALGFVLRGRV